MEGESITVSGRGTGEILAATAVALWNRRHRVDSRVWSCVLGKATRTRSSALFGEGGTPSVYIVGQATAAPLYSLITLGLFRISDADYYAAWRLESAVAGCLRGYGVDPLDGDAVADYVDGPRRLSEDAVDRMVVYEAVSPRVSGGDTRLRDLMLELELGDESLPTLVLSAEV